MVPTSVEDIQKMIRDQVQENVHLDYKDSRAIHDGAREAITKDVSAFANSDGGVIVYGVREEDRLPKELDEGVSITPCSREWIEAAVLSGIKPRIEGVRIYPIPRSETHSLYVVDVPKSYRGPHQASDLRYYKRHNFKSVPMQDYEIADLRLRQRHVPSLVLFETVAYHNAFAVFDISNVGDRPAVDVRFEFSPEIPWPDQDRMPQPLKRGIQRLAPRQRLRFRYFAFHQIFGAGSELPRQFSVRISYVHPEIGVRVADEWFVDFDSLVDSMIVRSEAEEQLKDLNEGVKKLTLQLEKVQRALEPIEELIGSTGLRLSFASIRDLGRVLREGKDPAALDPTNCRPSAFREVLGVDHDLAFALYQAFRRGNDLDRIKEIPGVTNELIVRMQRHFNVGLPGPEE